MLQAQRRGGQATRLEPEAGGANLLLLFRV